MTVKELHKAIQEDAKKLELYYKVKQQLKIAWLRKREIELQKIEQKYPSGIIPANILLTNF